ncbi:hypothetical protein [Proteiniphilum sp.]|nr:hypothetical protein [Proteiniphilum sp.]MEA4917727.1 hypothetical protein [Proteiniphilum sp.]
MNAFIIVEIYVSFKIKSCNFAGKSETVWIGGQWTVDKWTVDKWTGGF